MKLITEQPKNLLTATKEERQKFLDSFDFLLTDCDGMKWKGLSVLNRLTLLTQISFTGTLWDLVSPFEGVSEVLQSMKENGKRVVYVTNNATRSEQQYDDRFEKYNFNANFVSFLIKLLFRDFININLPRKTMSFIRALQLWITFDRLTFRVTSICWVRRFWRII